MPKYRKKAEVVEARQYTRNGLEAEDVANWCHGDQNDEGIKMDVHGNGSWLQLEYGDWIVKDSDGQFFGFARSQFEKEFFPVEGQAPPKDRKQCAVCGGSTDFLAHSASLCIKCGDNIAGNPKARIALADHIWKLRDEIQLLGGPKPS